MIVMETLFRQALGDNPKIRVLEFFIEGRELDYSISDIAEGAEISRTTLFRIWPNLKEANIIKPTRIIGNAKLPWDIFKIKSRPKRSEKINRLFEKI